MNRVEITHLRSEVLKYTAEVRISWAKRRQEDRKIGQQGAIFI